MAAQLSLFQMLQTPPEKLQIGRAGPLIVGRLVTPGVHRVGIVDIP